MFAFLSVHDAVERMVLLERFLVFWYGDARPEYGFPDAKSSALTLPVPLAQFYRVAGRWPTPNLRPYLQFFESEEEGYFYTGTAGHHLCDPGNLTSTADGRLSFFWESSGNWQLLTLPTGDDPPVWQEEEGTETLLPILLSELLVTHCLMATLYEEPNSAWSTRSHPPMTRLGTHFLASVHESELLWRVESTLPDYSGSFYLWRGNILVHRQPPDHYFAAIDPSGVDYLLHFTS